MAALMLHAPSVGEEAGAGNLMLSVFTVGHDGAELLFRLRGQADWPGRGFGPGKLKAGRDKESS